MAVKKIDAQDFENEVLNHKGVVFVDFYADWCGPCKISAPIIEELSEEMPNVKFLKVDVDANPQLAQQYGIFSIPTFIIFKDGQRVHQFVGARDKEGFRAEIETVVGN